MSSSSQNSTIQSPDLVRLEIRDWKIYSDQSPFVLGPLDIDLERGEIAGIIGKSGAGKSIFIKSLFGLIPEGYKFSERSFLTIFRRGGTSEIWYPHKMTETEWVQLRKHFWGYLPQDPIPSFDPVKRLKNQVSMIYRSRDLDFNISDFYKEYQKIGIDPSSGLMGKYPHELSGGQAQRMAFAMSRLGEPKVLVADEPTASLDSELIDTTASMILEWKVTNLGSAFVSSHDWAFISKIADKVFILDEGKICEKGDKDDVLFTPESEVGIEMKGSVLLPGEMTGTVSTEIQGTKVEIEQLSKTYHNGRSDTYALKNNTLTVDSPKLGIYGRSGSGKSTLAKIVSGIISPSAGQVKINDHLIDYKDTNRFRHLSHVVQYIAQDPYSAFSPRRTVGKSILEVMTVHNPNKSIHELQESFLDIMDKCQLHEKLANRYPDNLSGGEKQRFALIRAIACQPELLILDEVTAALDHVSRKRILDLVMELASDNKISYWVISHDHDVIQYMCANILYVNEGSISFDEIQ